MHDVCAMHTSRELFRLGCPTEQCQQRERVKRKRMQRADYAVHLSDKAPLHWLLKLLVNDCLDHV